MPLLTRLNNRRRVQAGQVILTASGVWTVPRGVKKIDVFLVGGGGGSGGGHFFFGFGAGQTYTGMMQCGGEGGAGYTATYKNIDVTPYQQIPVTIGAGGAMGGYYQLQADQYNSISVGTVSSPSYATNGGQGGTTSFGGFSVAGGYGGYKFDYDGGRQGRGGAGGSGGGGGQYFYMYRNYGGYVESSEDYPKGATGYDGGNGGNTSNGVAGGAGQGFTTRAFGEPSGLLCASRDGSYGLGGISQGISSSGGSAGVVIVRWATQ